MGSILVVDDDPQIRRVMRAVLSPQGYLIVEARDGQEALVKFRGERPDLVILDMNMPGMGGLEACREIRSASSVPIIIVTVRGAEKDKVNALDAGADDYLVKPFAVPELLARIRAILNNRRARFPATTLTHLRLGDVEIDFEIRQVKRGAEQERLTPKEFDTLSCLSAHANTIVTCDELRRAVWGSNSKDNNLLRGVVYQLRKKIESQPDHPKYLLTEPWVGYRLRLPE